MIAICAACKQPIKSKIIMNVLDRQWHPSCLQCAECRAMLDDKCFSKEGRVFCRDDYFRKFGQKCSGCGLGIDSQCMIRKASPQSDKIYHVQCFRCFICKKELETGEKYHPISDNKVLCIYDFNAGNRHATQPVLVADAFTSLLSEDEEDCLEAMEPGDLNLTSPLSEPPSSIHQNPHTPLTPNTPKNTTPIPPHTDIDKVSSLSIKEEDNSDDDLDSEKCLDDDKKITDDEKGNKRRGPRTTIKAKQLDVLKAAFNKTPKPTRHIREQLAKDTGLPMRVIQVWFQNKRSKERRMKQMSSLSMRGIYPPGRKMRDAYGMDEPYALFQSYNGFPGPQFPPYFGQPMYAGMGPGMEQPLPPGGPMGGDYPPMVGMNGLMADQFEPHPNMASPPDDMNGPTGFNDNPNSAVLACF